MSPKRARAFARALHELLGSQVRFDAGARALYATTGANYRQPPIAVTTPRTIAELVRTIGICRDFGVPILPRGGGTSLAGQSVNTAVILDASRHLTRIIDLDPDTRRAKVEPGVVLDDLRRAAEPHGLTFGPDPSTHAYCTLGGMIGNNSCGVHSVTAGRTSDNVESLDVLTADGVRLRVGPTSDAELSRLVHEPSRVGEIYGGLLRIRDRYADEIRRRFPRIPRRVSGFALDELLPEHGFNVARALVGSEGTCVTVLEATVRLVAKPPARVLAVLAYGDVFEAADAIPAVLEGEPLGVEGMDDRLVADTRRQELHPEAVAHLPAGGGWLLVEMGGETAADARAAAERLVRRLPLPARPRVARLFEDPHEQDQIWLVRESGLGATAHVPGRGLTWEGWEDSAVPPDRLGTYLREFRRLLDRNGYHGDLYGHFGDGCVHTRIDFDFRSEAGVARYLAFISDAADLVVRFGGSLSGEHGDGQSRGALLPRMFGSQLMDAFREFKRLWDPQDRMNPGKTIDAAPPDANLRLHPGLRLHTPSTVFAYADDGGDFSRAMLRCVGVGACRKTDSGTMCPSYMATRDERHSTRGRARLLFEMLRGDTLEGGWRNEHVKDALDLCLACKACKSECPVHVDMATYKAEFLSHYYDGRLRPRQAWAFGLISRWARIGSLLPWSARAFMQSRIGSVLVGRAAGIDPSRRLPPLAIDTFRGGGRRRAGAPARNGPQVLLWPDTFTTYFQPQIANAAVEVLERGGFSVSLPPKVLCCGRPLYDFGMLARARRWLGRVLEALDEPLRADTPIVVLEPSCASVFRDEAAGLFPGDARAARLARLTRHFAEFVGDHAGRFDLPQLAGTALLHGHCHQKSLGSMKAEEELLARLGLRVRAPDTGCCGMAGAFGFEDGKAGLSREIGERVLLPAVRAAAPDTVIVTDGFSCREQIAQLTPRRGRHIAEVLRAAMHLRTGDRLDARALPEDEPAGRPGPPLREWLILGAGALVVAAGAWLWRRSRRGAWRMF